MNNLQRGSLQLYLVVILLAVLAFGLGLWDILIEREGGGWLVQIILPAVLIVILGGLYSQAKRERIALEKEPSADDTPADDVSLTDEPES